MDQIPKDGESYKIWHTYYNCYMDIYWCKKNNKYLLEGTNVEIDGPFKHWVDKDNKCHLVDDGIPSK